MTRWEPNADGRLKEAAMELFEQRGYEETTVADIAERAGLTKRTFFRYFPDKREVLFDASDRFTGVFLDAFAASPADAAPLDAVAIALEGVAGWFASFRDHAHSARRHAILSANPSLQERELVKLAGVAVALAAALRDRGVPEPDASVAAEIGIAVFRVAFDRWATLPPGTDTPLTDVMRDALTTLRSVAAPA